MNTVYRIACFGADPASLSYDFIDVLGCVPGDGGGLRWGILNLGWLEDTKNDPWLENLNLRLEKSPKGLEVGFDDLLRLAKALNNITWLLVVGCKGDPLSITKKTLYTATIAIERFDSGPYVVYSNSDEFITRLKRRFKRLEPTPDLDHRISTMDPWPNDA